jgi:hypothetical protein
MSVSTLDCQGAAAASTSPRQKGKKSPRDETIASQMDSQNGFDYACRCTDQAVLEKFK